MGSVSKEITEGVCFVEETAIATGGMAQPAIASGGKGGEKGVLSLAVAIWPRRMERGGCRQWERRHTQLVPLAPLATHPAGTVTWDSPTVLARQPFT